MKQFEAFLGNDFRAWAASETCTIKKTGDRVELTQVIGDGRKAKTTFNLKNLPAYSFVE